MTRKNLETLHFEVEKKKNIKLVIPLALEYKKEGKIEEAVNILIKGLTWHPDYLSAHIILGTLYFENNRLLEATEEFEKVINKVDDNIFALKKLLEIYYGSESFEKAKSICQKILLIAPDDSDASSVLSLIETKEASESVTLNNEETQNDLEEDEIPRQEQDSASVQLELPEQAEDKKVIINSHDLAVKELSIESLTKPSDEELPKDNGKTSLNVNEFQTKHFPATSTMADICIIQGLFEEALNIYEKILYNEPENKVIKQKRHELVQLIDYKDRKKKEILVRNLADFMDKLRTGKE